jgi:hypothetical protein
MNTALPSISHGATGEVRCASVERPSVDDVAAFLQDKSVGPLHMTLSCLLVQDDDFLERCHEFIQWLFPLNTPSAYHPHAPVLTTDELKILGEQAHEGTARAFERMLRFYGLRSRTDGRVSPGPNWDERMVEWVPEFTHNSQRLTRILRSLTLQGHERRATALLEFLTGLFSDRLCPPSRLVERGHWVQAVRNPANAGLAH